MNKSVETLREFIDSKKYSYQQLFSSYKKENEYLEQAKIKMSDATEAQQLIQDTAQMIQKKAHNQIASVVTKGLQTVFDKPYIFKIEFEKKRGRTEAHLIFEKDGIEFDPLTECGGGLIDIAALTLRVACLMLSKPKARPVIILDEPFKNVSKEKGYLDKVPLFLNGLADDMGIQIIVVTHIDELKVGKIVEVGYE